MPARDLHNKPFDEGTKTKLEIYRSYVRAWLQVFLHASAFRGKPLQFFDFFCGPGESVHGIAMKAMLLVPRTLAKYETTRSGSGRRLPFSKQAVHGLFVSQNRAVRDSGSSGASECRRSLNVPLCRAVFVLRSVLCIHRVNESAVLSTLD